jgi:hypothetical protein
MATIVNNLNASVEDQKAMLRAKVDVNIKRNYFKIGNLKVV